MWALALLALLAGMAGHASGQCLLQLPVAEGQGAITFTGTSTSPLRAPIALQGAPALSLAGNVGLQLAGACPGSQAALLAALPGASLQAQAGAQLALLPANLTAQVSGGLATLALSGLAFNLSSDPLGSSGGNTTVFAGLAGGQVAVSSALGGGGAPVSLAGPVANSTAIVSMTDQGGRLQLTLAGVNLSYPSSFTVAGVRGEAVYSLGGTIVAQASIDSLLGGSSSPAAAPAPAPARQPPAAQPSLGLSDAVLQAPAPAPGAAPGPLTSLAAIRRLSCLNGAGGGCASCRPGWAGGFCDVCRTDAACNAFLGTSDATCSTSSAYANTTAFKSYSCDISGSVLGTVLSRFALACNTSSGIGQAGGYCQVALGVQGADDNPAVCVVTDCAFQAGSSRVQCRNAACSCQKGACPDQVAAYAALIQGRDVAVDCEAGGTCDVNIQNFPVRVRLPCTTGDCRSPTNPALFSSITTIAEARTDSSLPAVIAAIPLMLLAALALLALLSAALPQRLCAGARALPPQPPPPVGELRWDRICVDVKLSRFAARSPQGDCGAQQDGMAESDAGDGKLSQPINGSAHVNGGAALAEEGHGSSRGEPPRWRAWLACLAAPLHPRPRLRVLEGVSGRAVAGKLLGILGPSGSGKSTLLSVLAGSSASLGASARVRGRVLLDGRPAAGGHPPAFVPQSDWLLPSLTVRETLWYSCRLRLPDATPAAVIEERVAAVVAELGLGEVAGSLVGGAGGVRGVSGGERRRVAIGMELVGEARLLLLDEPTSGLDAATAAGLLRSLRRIARAGRVVVLSIHQPSPAAFGLLDACLLMCRGRVAFAGAPAAAPRFFAEAGLPCAPGDAIAEHALACVASPGARATLLAHAAARPQPADEPAGKSAPPPAAAAAGRGRASLRTELAVLSWRALTDIRRSPGLLLLHLAISAVMGVLVGGIFFELKLDIAGAQGRLGAVFFTLCLAGLTALTTVDALAAERGLVQRELQAGCYRPLPYYLSKACLDALLLRVLPILVYAVPMYAMAGLQGAADRVALFFCVAAAFAATIGLLSMALTIGFNSAGKATLLMNVILLLMLLFAGYFRDLESITPVLRWVRWVNPYYYTFTALVINEFMGLLLSFTAAPGVSADLNGEAFLNAIKLSPGVLLRDVALLDALFAAFGLLGLGLLHLTLPRPLRLRPG